VLLSMRHKGVMIGTGGVSAVGASRRVHERAMRDTAAQLHTHPRRDDLGVLWLVKQLVWCLCEIEPAVAIVVESDAVLHDGTTAIELLA